MASASLASTPRVAAPSPSRSNPFARPALPKSGSFTRSCLLPTLPSPVKPQVDSVDSTPDGKLSSTAAVGSVGKSRSAWRLLWRGGLEIGKEGYRLDGVTFFALLNFPSTPSGPVSNPFDIPQTPSQPTSAISQSPFALPSADTDICLSLESMRGRKYLQVRGLTDLAESEVLEGSDNADGGGVHMAISPSAPLLIAYFSGLLCRDPKLSEAGRTKKAVLLGLGDDESPQNTLLVYGQLQPDSSTIRLLVSRRRPPAPPPSEIKIKPGEPLPRAPLFFPAKRGKPLPFPNRTTLAKSRSFSRTSSVSSIYAPPVLPSHHSAPILPTTSIQPHAPVSGRTPGRRGEKRPKTGIGDEERKRKAGRVVPVEQEIAEETDVDTPFEFDEIDVGLGSRKVGEEDIFGKTLSKITAHQSSEVTGETSASAKKRTRVPQQVLDNKAMIRKQAMVMMESRGFSRDHEIFKDVFGITIKGVYFVFRDSMLDAPLDKHFVQSYISKHLDMYLPLPSRPEGSEASGEDTAVDIEEESALLAMTIKQEQEGLVPESEQEDQEDGDEAERTGGGEDMIGILPLNTGLFDEDYGKTERGREGYRMVVKQKRGMEVVQEEDEGED